MFIKDLKNTKGIALSYLIIIILFVLIISAVAIVGGKKILKKEGSNQEISQENTKTENDKNETANISKKTTSKNNKGTKITADEIANNPEKYYGQEVKNYTNGDRVYRIFYVDTEGYFGDKNTIYLKADWVEEEFNLFNEKLNNGVDKYTPKDTKILEKMNQEWAKERLNATWNENEHCAAWLCDPTTKDASSNQEWASYFDSNKANYVIGSPSAEMYVRSYNQVKHEKEDIVLKLAYKTESYPGYANISGYTGKLDAEGYNGMYNSKGKSYSYNCTWLASPSNNSCFSMCFVGGYYGDLSYNTFFDAFGLSPIVSLKADFTPEI